MKKYVAHNRAGDKVFCKYEMFKTGILCVEYYLPKGGFSVIWEGKLFRVADVRDSADGRKTIVTYHIHPGYWMFQDLKHMSYMTWFDAMNDCLFANINLHI